MANTLAYYITTVESFIVQAQELDYYPPIFVER
jgi:hypothetical protein